jgi:hypothetical protein
MLGAVLFCATAAASTPDDPAVYKQEVKAGVEEIYVFRTVRTERVRGATDHCKAAPFESVTEDVYDLWSMSLNTRDGRVTKTHEKPVGQFRACFSAIVERKSFRMYFPGKVAGIPYVGVGDCTIGEWQPPVRTLLAINCSAKLNDLPSTYKGGFMVSSSLAPVTPPGQESSAHVPGYLSTSVVTVRLWR